MRATLVTVLLAFAAAASAQDAPPSWKGQLVVGTKPNEDIRFGAWVNDKYEEFAFRGHYPITVRDEKDGWLRLFDGHREAWASKADFVLSRDAPAYFTDRVRANPSDTFAWISRGIGWYDRGEYDNAIKDYDEAIRSAPKNASAFNCRGNAWHSKRDLGRALKDYDEAIRLDPKFAVAFNNRGNVWKEDDDLERALKDFDEAIRLDPRYALAFSNRGSVWRVKGDTDRALKDFDEAIRLDPKYDWARLNRAVILLVARRPGAVEECRAILERQGWSGDRSTSAVIVGHLAARAEKDEATAKQFLADGAVKLKLGWPAPVVGFLRGALDEPALLKLATNREKETDARAYLGLDHLMRGRTTAARDHFHWVREHGNKSYLGYTIAVAELARLEKADPPPKP